MELNGALILSIIDAEGKHLINIACWLHCISKSVMCSVVCLLAALHFKNCVIECSVVFEKDTSKEVHSYRYVLCHNIDFLLYTLSCQILK